uniref:Uncharacterized protein n=1 Tax=Arundo donax TaxID=35708 RepID=A0A0A9F7X0_ARUDO
MSSAVLCTLESPDHCIKVHLCKCVCIGQHKVTKWSCIHANNTNYSFCLETKFEIVNRDA